MKTIDSLPKMPPDEVAKKAVRVMFESINLMATATNTDGNEFWENLSAKEQVNFIQKSVEVVYEAQKGLVFRVLGTL